MAEEEQKITKGQKAYLKRIVNEFQKDAQKALEELASLKNDLLAGEEGLPSLPEQFESAAIEIEESRSKIESFYNKIFVPQESREDSLAEGITSFVSEYEKATHSIAELHAKIEQYSRDLFGYTNEDGEDIAGIQDKINIQIDRLKKLHDDNSEKQDALFNEIEGLLKGASTVALSKAFKEHKDSFDLTNHIWLVVFVVSIVSMMGLSIWAFVNANYQFEDMWKYTLGNIPFIGGAIWLAIYSSKQRSQNKRLQQEYAFKEDVAKIYYGLKKEIEDLGESDIGQKLNESVLKVIIDVVSLNPSSTLDSNSHNDKGPILEVLNSIKSSFNKG